MQRQEPFLKAVYSFRKRRIITIKVKNCASLICNEKSSIILLPDLMTPSVPVISLKNSKLLPMATLLSSTVTAVCPSDFSRCRQRRIQSMLSLTMMHDHRFHFGHSRLQRFRQRIASAVKNRIFPLNITKSSGPEHQTGEIWKLVRLYIEPSKRHFARH